MGLSLCVCEHSASMADPVLPLSLELFALRAYVLSFAVFEIIKIIAFISRTIFPLEDSEALHLSLRKSSLILTLFITIFVHKRHEAFSVKFIIFKNTLIDRFIHKLISSFSMFSSIKKFSPVVALLFGPELFSLTTRQRI